LFVSACTAVVQPGMASSGGNESGGPVWSPSASTWNIGEAARSMRSHLEQGAGAARQHISEGAGAARSGLDKGAGWAQQKVEKVKAKVEQEVGKNATSAAQPTWNHASSSSAAAVGPLPPIEVRACSWNMHGSQIDPADDLTTWLAPEVGPLPDVLVVGIQELVDLGPRSVVLSASGDSGRQAALEARIEEVLKASCAEERGHQSAGGYSGPYVKLRSFGMVGLALVVYIRKGLMPHVDDVDCDRVKTGVDGKAGNKGCVCLRLRLGELSLCFINVHLASGQHAVAERNAHVTQVIKDAFQSVSQRGATRPAKCGFQRRSEYYVGLHHMCIILGDFNARLDLPSEAAWPTNLSVDASGETLSEEWQVYLKRDQLLLGQMSSLRGFREGMIRFPPTYKYAATGSNQLATSRCPAWCDRVVFKTEYGTETELLEYKAFLEVKRTSDHRPVAAQILVALPGSMRPEEEEPEVLDAVASSGPALARSSSPISVERTALLAQQQDTNQLASPLGLASGGAVASSSAAQAAGSPSNQSSSSAGGDLPSPTRDSGAIAPLLAESPSNQSSSSAGGDLPSPTRDSSALPASPDSAQPAGAFEALESPSAGSGAAEDWGVAGTLFSPPPRTASPNAVPTVSSTPKAAVVPEQPGDAAHLVGSEWPAWPSSVPSEQQQTSATALPQEQGGDGSGST